jgi:A-factor type gamma-butyrolactone 1'-reductase (1S-forming)
LGATVVLAVRSTDALTTLVEEITVLGGSALAVPTYVVNSASVATLVTQTIEVYKHLDIAFNNTGIGSPNARLTKVSEEEVGPGYG